MKKQNKIYAIIISIVVCTVFILSIIFIFNNSSLSAKDVSQEDFRKNIIPRDIKPELLKIKDFIFKAEMPDEAETVKTIRKTIEKSIDAWDECQELVNSKKLHLEYKKGEAYMASYEDAVNRTKFNIFLQSEKGKIGQCTKTVFYPEGDGKKIKTYYVLYFNEDLNIKSYKDPNTEVYFYLSGLVKSVFYDVPDGKRYSIRWSEDCNITDRGSYDKQNKDPLLLEAEEKAEKMLRDYQERAQKEYEEYKRKMNIEETDSAINKQY